ncbi:MAG: multicopper oxidase domain-containing protein, partial [Candidatus Eremiobacteraeota bacterium]|nr:multicopper oxidase domain-containing protein [Candidatus Eremiobacteraeota bacterium]
ALPQVGTTLLDPPNLSSSNGVLALTLTLISDSRRGSTALCGAYLATVDGKVRALSVPPTLNVKQGERLSITLINALMPPFGGVETPPPIEIHGDASQENPYALMCGQPQLAPTPTPDPVTGRIYGYHRSPWNEANLHFHGLNTSPKAPGDDVTDVLLCPHVASAPETYHYVVDIPRDEPPGTYWYHPHAHGESLYQMFLGLTGAIVVHSAQPSVPDRLPNRIAIVRDLPARPGFSKYANIARAQRATGVPDFRRNPGGDPFQSPDHCPSQGSLRIQTDYLTVNGLQLPLDGNSLFGLPEAKIDAGETQYWRVANTAANTTLDVVLLVNGKPSPLLVTSRDGVPLVVKNGKPTYQPVAMEHVFLMPAARFEFYLTGATPGAEMVVRTRTVDTGCIGDVDLERDLFHVKVGTKRTDQRFSLPPVTDSTRQRFSDLASQVPTRKRTFVLTEYARSDEPEPDFYITETSNPKAVEHPYRMAGRPDTIVKDGTVEEWTILNYTNEIHAFHIHQIHFLPTAGIDVAEGLNQLLDTVVVPHGGYDMSRKFVPGAVKLNMDFRDRNIVGTFVYHCHIMEHEDAGMMARIQVVR